MDFYSGSQFLGYFVYVMTEFNILSTELRTSSFKFCQDS